MDQKERYNHFVNDFSSVLYALTNNREFSNVIFLCIGTDRVTGDSFGPMVGYKLNRLFSDNNKVEIIGDLNKLVCSANINETINNMNRNYANPFVIAVDSAISENNSPGTIIVSDKGVTLGSGVNRQVTNIGDMSIKGVVTTNLNNSRFNMRLLQNVRLNLIVNMADIVSRGVHSVIEIV